MAELKTTSAGDRVYVEPRRTQRPRGDGPCPFCAGNESMTPPTVAQRPRQGAWSARAFANKFPITRRHEVVVDTPRHVLTFAQLSPEEAAEAAALYVERARACHRDGLHYLVFRNEGAEAGGSIPHAHAQLVADQTPFPRLARPDDPRAEAAARVAMLEDFELRVPAVARFPYEAWIVPRTPGPDFHELDEKKAASLGRALRAVSGPMHELSRGKGWNVFLAGGEPWRLDLVSRAERIAGFELGAGVWVNPVDHEASVAAWKAALKSS